MDLVGKLFGAIDGFFSGIVRGVRGVLRAAVDGPLMGLMFYAILGFTGLVVVVERLWRLLERVATFIEEWAIILAMGAMTFLAFNEYLAREYKPLLGTDLFGIWAIEGQMNLALLLMVFVGFLGGSVTTRTGGHLTVDAAEKVLAPGASRFVKRLTSLVAAGLCLTLANGGWHKAIESKELAFPGVTVYGWMVAPLNGLMQLLPGHKMGPGTAYPTASAFEDAMYAKGFTWENIPKAWQMVQAGDKFPLWLPIGVLVVAFGLMGLRFLAMAVNPGEAPTTERVGNRRVADVVLAGAFPGALIALFIAAYFGTGAAIVLSSILLIFLGAPLFVGLGVGTLACWTLIRTGGAETVVADMFESTVKAELLAIPFFVLAGNLMTKGTIAARLIKFTEALLGPLPGGLGVGAVLACTLFAAISGSSPVTVIAIGTIVFPMLVKQGYDEGYSLGVLTTAGGLGIIIPPSIPMIIYAIMVSGIPSIGSAVTPKKLFVAGVGPGLFIASCLALYTLYRCWPREGFAGIKPYEPDPAEGPYLTRVARAGMKGALSLFLPVLILGGIYDLFTLEPFGIEFAVRFSVTEAAAVSVVYALVVELFFHRELKWYDLGKVFVESAEMMGSLFLILVLAISLNRFFVFQEVPEAATAFMLEYVDSKLTFLIFVNLFLLALGCVMDIMSAILIVAPLLAPIAQSYGIDPVHFGIMFIVNLELGYLTPPMGINLFVASSTFKRPLLDVIKAVGPFLILMLFCLAVVVVFPSLSLYLGS